MLYGVALGQTVHYYRSFPTDHKWIKSLVAFVLVAETLQQVLIVHSQWRYVVVRCIGVTAPCVKDSWSIVFQTCPSTLIFLTVQLFYISKIWKFGQHRMSIFLIICSLISAGSSIAFMILEWLLQVDVPQDWRKGKMATATLLTISGLHTAVTDVGITVIMCRWLYKSSRDVTQVHRSLTLRIIKYFVASGMFSSCTTAAFLIAFWVSPGSMGWIATYFVGSKGYSNSMLALLNNRKVMRSKLRLADKSLVTSPELHEAQNHHLRECASLPASHWGIAV
ncbi:hypothetical protein OE88DRAFT_1664275 [Heliocybe sulcata]|uniref:DUF6534 domain-containing protein n=1 Tax=Heliocybe sulcata TaxID=5364 RepID=A0A5C3N3W1_9AGAM|nr:hypothetical protein OE88DRAFT_1664275 [Heliocybe sulcata]